MSSLELARHQWAEGKRMLDAAGDDTARSRHLLMLVEAVEDQLARRVGQTFTLAELARAYQGSEDWVRDRLLCAGKVESRDQGHRARAGRRLRPLRAGRERLPSLTCPPISAPPNERASVSERGAAAGRTAAAFSSGWYGFSWRQWCSQQGLPSGERSKAAAGAAIRTQRCVRSRSRR